MAAALECCSGQLSTDEEILNKLLRKTHHRSDAFRPALPRKKWNRLSRNVAAAITALKNSVNLDSLPPSLTHLFPGIQIAEKPGSDIRRHFDSLPNSYSQAGFDIKEVFLHRRLVEQAANDGLPAVQIHQISGEGSVFKIIFAGKSAFSWPTMTGAIGGSVLCKKIQIFEKRGLTLGVVTVVVEPGGEKHFKTRIEAALRSTTKKQRSAGVKLHFSLCGCEDEGFRATEDESSASVAATEFKDLRRIRLPCPLPQSLLVVSVDEWQTIRFGREELGRWILGAEEMEFVERAGVNSFIGSYKGKKVWIKKLKGCERGSAYEIEIRQDLMQIMSCGQKKLLQFFGVCFNNRNGLCLVTPLMEGGSVHDLIQRRKMVPVRDVIRIALDVAEGLLFMESHGVAYRNLNTQRILLDRQGNACLGDMGIVSTCMNSGNVREYETAGYRWLAPEIIAGDPESKTETWMSNVYSFGMVLWEMVTGEAAYSSYSPVQAAVGIAACGLRPEIPKDCPPVLRSLMIRCWNNCPSKRPQLSEIVAILLKQNIW